MISTLMPRIGQSISDILKMSSITFCTSRDFNMVVSFSRSVTIMKEALSMALMFLTKLTIISFFRSSRILQHNVVVGKLNMGSLACYNVLYVESNNWTVLNFHISKAKNLFDHKLHLLKAAKFVNKVSRVNFINLFWYLYRIQMLRRQTNLYQ